MLGGTVAAAGVALIALCTVAILRMKDTYGHGKWLAEYDFIIVGGGPAGCVLANRLSADPDHTVLLLEAGVDYSEGAITMDVPLAAPGNFLSPSLYWRDLSEPHEPGVGQVFRDSRVSHPHGKILGGSSSINMMMYARGSPSDYDHWEDSGASGWSWEGVEPFFRRLENAANIPNADGMGDTGPLHVTVDTPFHSISQYLLNSSAELGVDVTHNYNHPKANFGTGYTQTMSHKGRRWSVVSAYLDPVRNRSNLHIITGAHATKVLFEERTAVGVEFMKNRLLHSVACRAEVILSAGVYNSPHLLMLSGIGPQDHLIQNKIEVIHNLPGVGENLQDHPAVNENIFVDSIPGISMSAYDVTLSNILQYITHGKGLLAGNSFPLVTFLGVNSSNWLRTDELAPHINTAPDVHIMFAALPLGGVNPLGVFQNVYDFLNIDDKTVSHYYQNSERPYGTAMVISLAKPKSRGTVRLFSNDPADRPEINTKLLSHPDDIQTLKQGLKFVYSLTKTKSLLSVGGYLLDDKYPKRERFCSEYVPYSDEHLDCYVKAMIGTAFHGVGTCKMGTDHMSVVDSQLRVHGVNSLRVVDASVMPKIVSANTQGPTMMIAERAADFILNEEKSDKH